MRHVHLRGHLIRSTHPHTHTTTTTHLSLTTPSDPFATYFEPSPFAERAPAFFFFGEAIPSRETSKDHFRDSRPRHEFGNFSILSFFLLNLTRENSLQDAIPNPKCHCIQRRIWLGPPSLPCVSTAIPTSSFTYIHEPILCNPHVMSRCLINLLLQPRHYYSVWSRQLYMSPVLGSLFRCPFFSPQRRSPSPPPPVSTRITASPAKDHHRPSACHRFKAAVSIKILPPNK
ncbi:hypothetical protein IF2G_08734 [Cordyceps javanica]|nr:hypothetical protein IF2G_08734 [Cordyceps javanica]